MLFSAFSSLWSPNLQYISWMTANSCKYTISTWYPTLAVSSVAEFFDLKMNIKLERLWKIGQKNSKRFFWMMNLFKMKNEWKLPDFDNNLWELADAITRLLNPSLARRQTSSLSFNKRDCDSSIDYFRSFYLVPWQSKHPIFP